MNITIKDVEYNLERLLLLHHKGVRADMDSTKLVGWDEALSTVDIEHAIVVPTADNKLLTILRPVHPTKQVYILSKYILKQCLSTTHYVPTSTYERFTDRYSQQNRYNKRDDYSR